MIYDIDVGHKACFLAFLLRVLGVHKNHIPLLPPNPLVTNHPTKICLVCPPQSLQGHAWTVNDLLVGYGGLRLVHAGTIRLYKPTIYPLKPLHKNEDCTGDFEQRLGNPNHHISYNH